MSDSFDYLLALSQLKGIGIATARKLISYCGSPEAVFKEQKQKLLKIPGIGKSFVQNLRLSGDIRNLVDQEKIFIEKEKIKVVTFNDKEYPSRLKQCNDAPLYLYVKGNLRFNYKKVIAIVGTRKATREGKEYCGAIVSQIREKWEDVLIISGLAYGIDIASQKAALKNNLPTVAILAHSLDKIYPPVHANYAKEMQKEGAVISEFSSFDNFDRQNFIKRNRIIAGMSDALIVVESDVNGGAMITAEIANSYNREIFAVPGSLGNKVAKGCHKLIKKHKAHLIESVEDLAYIMNWESEKEQLRLNLFDLSLSSIEQKIVNYLKGNGETSADGLKIGLGVSFLELNHSLLNLELNGCITCLPGKTYIVNNPV